MLHAITVSFDKKSFDCKKLCPQIKLIKSMENKDQQLMHTKK